MANLSMTPAPGYYAVAPVATFEFGVDVNYISYTENGAQPTSSEYIAYDQLTPPTPFLAVTQDGRGNVVYDGGFPKFYNNRAPAGSPFTFPVLAWNAVCNYPADAAGNNYIYDKFSNLSIVIQAGWVLEFEVWAGGPQERVSIDCTVSGSLTKLRDFPTNTSRQILDQNGLSIHADATLNGLSVGKWYKRVFSLTPVVGRTLSDWTLVMKGDTPGNYTGYFRNILIKDQQGVVQGIIYASEASVSLDVPLSSVVEGSGYVQNTKAILSVQSFAAEHKFLKNALNFIANPTKVAAGNKHILVLGDRTTAPYWIKGNSNNDFWTALSRIAHSEGFNLVTRDAASYGGTLNPNLTELDKYAGVLVMSSQSSGSVLITSQAIADLVTYREAGNGLIVITDDGRTVTTIEDSANAASGSFFNMANAIVRNFGAWFSGNYNRSPVNVGFLRSNYGDHPLYANMLDTESIFAGGSESRVFVATYPKVVPGDGTEVEVANNSRTVVRVLVVMKNGTTESYRFVYSTGTDKLLETVDPFGLVVGQNLQLGFGGGLQLDTTVFGAGLGSISGEVTIGGKRKAFFSYTEETGTQLDWFTGVPWLHRPNKLEQVSYTINSPFLYSQNFVAQVNQPALNDSVSLPDIIKKMKADGFAASSVRNVLSNAFTKMTETLTWLNPNRPLSSAAYVKHARDWFGGDKELPPLITNIFATTAEATAYRGSTRKTALELFGNGGRFQNGAFYAPGQANPVSNWSAALAGDGSLTFTVPENVEGWSGFLGSQKYTNYQIDCVVSAAWPGDQPIALVLGWLGGTQQQPSSNQSLMLQIQRGGAYPRAALSVVVNNHLFKTTMTDQVPPQDDRYKLIMENTVIPIAEPNAGTGWANNKIAVRVLRDQNRLFILAGQPTTGTPTLDNATLMQIDLAASVYLKPFLSACQVGVAVQKQGNVTISQFRIKGGRHDNLVIDAGQRRMFWRRGNTSIFTLLPVNMVDALGAPRKITNPDTGQSWMLNKDGTLTAL